MVCQDYAKAHDILILDTYIDQAISGTTDNRADFQRMIKDSARKEWDYVLVYKLDRFSRDKYATAIHKKTLRDNGVKVLSAMENIPDTPEGIILESLLEEFERSNGHKKTKFENESSLIQWKVKVGTPKGIPTFMLPFYRPLKTRVFGIPRARRHHKTFIPRRT